LNLASDFPDRWQAFMNRPTDGMRFTVDRRRLPNAGSGNVTGVYLHYEMVDDPVDDLGRQAVALNGITLKPGAFKSVTGSVLPLVDHVDPAHPTWTLKPSNSAAAKFSSRNLRTIALVITYASKPTF
jgi:hypothetical protein